MVGPSHQPNKHVTTQHPLPITPEAFWMQISTELGKRWVEDEQVKIKYHNDAAWTGFMTELLALMATRFNCHPDLEYWPRVDVSYFKQPGPNCPDWAEWSREVAIELENNDTWKDEICKLIEINAGLKVLIAYSGDRSKTEKILDELPKILESRKYITSPCNWLFIFGPHGEAFEDFIAFKFDGKTRTDITGKAKIKSKSASDSTSF